MKTVKDIKKGDILWSINDSLYPKLIALPIIDVKIRKHLWTTDYEVLVKMPDGKELWCNFFDNGCERDYDIPFLTSLSPQIWDFENELHILAGFEKKKLYEHYIDGLNRSIKSVEEVIENGKKNLIDLKTKLNYINKQKDIINEK